MRANCNGDSVFFCVVKKKKKRLERSTETSWFEHLMKTVGKRAGKYRKRDVD